MRTAYREITGIKFGNNRALVLCLLILAYCVTTPAADSGTTPPSNNESENIPDVLVPILLRSSYAEDAVAAALKYLRQTGSDPNSLKQSDIEAMEEKNTRQSRLTQIYGILKYDLNNDGVIGKDEISAYLTETQGASRSSYQLKNELRKFDEYDTDKNGKVDFREMRTLAASSSANIDRQLDTYRELLALDPNHDKVLTRDELLPIINKAIAAVDANNDSILSPEEKKTLQAARVPAPVRTGPCAPAHPDIFDNTKDYTAYRAGGESPTGGGSAQLKAIELDGGVKAYTLVSNSKPLVSAYVNNAVPGQQKYEMHVVSSYRGDRKISVLPGKKPLVLVLASYESSIWTFDIHKGARVHEVILLGYKEQRVKGLPDGIKVTRMPRECAGTFTYEWKPGNRFEGKANKKFAGFIKYIQQFTGLIESSFQGASLLPPGVEVPLNTEDYQRYEISFRDPSVKVSRKESLENYRKFQKTLPREVKDTFSILVRMMEKGRFPVHLPNDPSGIPIPAGARYFEELAFPDYQVYRTSADSPSVECNNRGNGILIGDNGINNLTCGWGNQIYWGGDGVDHIDDSWGNDIINGGGGDDMIDAGWGRDIIVFEKHWGTDIVDKTCTSAQSPDPQRMYGPKEDKDWSYPFINFVVFGPGIYRRDMEMKGNVLKNKKTGDQVTFEGGQCFNIVYYEDK